MKNGIRLTIYIFIIILSVLCIVFVHVHVNALWREVAARQALLEDVPAQLNHTATLKKELETATREMKGMYAAIPTRDGLVAVISEISGVAVATGVSAQLPIVEASSASPTPVPSTSVSPAPYNPFSDVRIRIVASGDVTALAAFLYRVEHLPYLLRIVSWKIDTLQQAAISSFASTVPNDGQAIPTPVLGTSLVAEVSIVVRQQ